MSDIDRDIETLSTENSYLRARVDRLESQLREVRTEMRHCRVFVTSREKIHPTGLELYDKLRGSIDAELEDT